MKKKLFVTLMMAMTLGLLSGCGNESEESLSPIMTPNPQPIVSEAPEEGSADEKVPEEEPEYLPNGMKKGGETHTIGERVEKDGKIQSHLTGEWKDTAIANRRPMAVMVPNNPPAMPQYGISKASIIYEAPVEGRITRLMAIVEDYDDLDRIGPVRSSRDYYIYEAMAYDAIYCNWGLAVPYAGPLLNSTRIDNISQTVSGMEAGYTYSGAFDRVSRPGYAKEFTGYLFTDGYTKGVEKMGYEKEYTDRFVNGFTFADDGYMATYDDYPTATKIYPGGTQSNSGGYGSNNACFTYNEEDGLYYRSQYSQKQIDELTGEQLAVTNVVFKICHGEVRDDHDYLAFGVHGTGDAYVFTNGKVIKGTWSRESDYAANVFLDENGNEIALNQGKTWMCCIWKEYSEFMKWE